MLRSGSNAPLQLIPEAQLSEGRHISSTLETEGLCSRWRYFVYPVLIDAVAVRGPAKGRCEGTSHPGEKKNTLFPHPLMPVSTSPNCRTSGVGLNSTLFHRAQKHTFIVLQKNRQLLTGFSKQFQKGAIWRIKSSVPSFPATSYIAPVAFRSLLQDKAIMKMKVCKRVRNRLTAWKVQAASLSSLPVRAKSAAVCSLALIECESELC